MRGYKGSVNGDRDLGGSWFFFLFVFFFGVFGVLGLLGFGSFRRCRGGFLRGFEGFRRAS